MVAIWELADNARIEDFGGGRGLEVQIKTQRSYDSGRGASFEETSARVIHQNRMPLADIESRSNSCY